MLPFNRFTRKLNDAIRKADNPPPAPLHQPTPRWQIEDELEKLFIATSTEDFDHLLINLNRWLLDHRPRPHQPSHYTPNPHD